ncbi:MAG: glycosyltransferase, partial [Methylophilaceae bacterium]
AFYSSEVYLLPSHQENFGIAVAEALACGLPVLISDKVNIWREIEADGVGVVNSDTVEGTEKSLRSWLSLSQQAQDAMAKSAKLTFSKRFTVDSMAKDLILIIEKYKTDDLLATQNPHMGHSK